MKWLALLPLTLFWDLNPTTNVVTNPFGYNLYWGTNSGHYGAPIDVGFVQTYPLNLPDGTCPCYFAVSAYNLMGIESDLSIEAVYIPPGWVPPPPVIPAPRLFVDWFTNKSPVIRWSWTNGYCDTLQSTTSLINWTDIGRQFYATNAGEVRVSVDPRRPRIFRVRRGLTCLP